MYGFLLMVLVGIPLYLLLQPPNIFYNRGFLFYNHVYHLETPGDQ